MGTGTEDDGVGGISIMPSKERYQYLKAQGLCVSCGNKAAEGKARCEECLNKDTERHFAKRSRYKSEGLCTQCGDKLSMFDVRIDNGEPLVLCLDCQEKNYMCCVNRL